MSEQTNERSAQTSITIPSNGVFCSKCGHKNVEDGIFCTKCGSKLCGEQGSATSNNSNDRSQKKKTNIFSVLSIIFSCLGIIPVAGFLFWIVALVLGIIGLATMKNKNKGPTIASGVAICVFLYISVVTTAVFSIYFSGSDEIHLVTEEQNISSPSVITTDSLELYVDNVYISEEFYSNPAPEGMRYCYIKGTINNNSLDDLRIDITGNFIFDGANIYEGLFSISNSTSIHYNNIYEVTNYALIEAYRDKAFCFSCLIPEEIANNYTSAEVTFEVVGADAPGPYSISFSD